MRRWADKAPDAPWNAAVATCRGSAHEAAGLPCQDAVARLERAGCTAVALADGAGSAALSHEGAALVANRAAEIACDRFDEVFARNIPAARFASWLVRGLQWELSQHADHAHGGACQLRDLASTLLLAAVRDGRYLALHLGDGVVGVRLERPWPGAGQSARAVRVLSAPANGEFANQTVFTTSPDAAGHLRVIRGRTCGRTAHVTGFILMSDGPEASLYHKPTRTLAGACGKLLDHASQAAPERTEELLARTLADRIARKTADDCSLALLARIACA